MTIPTLRDQTESAFLDALDAYRASHNADTRYALRSAIEDLRAAEQRDRARFAAAVARALMRRAA